MSDNQFSIRLADGQEKTFESAAEMAKWISEQRQNRRPAKKRFAKNVKRKKTRQVRCSSGDSPLARFVSATSKSQ